MNPVFSNPSPSEVVRGLSAQAAGLATAPGDTTEELRQRAALRPATPPAAPDFIRSNQGVVMNTTTSNASQPNLEKLARRRAGAKMGWYIHAFVYVLVNIGLVGISAGATPGRCIR
jgi:hypothetical protein